jgi:hypothetical protein
MSTFPVNLNIGNLRVECPLPRVARVRQHFDAPVLEDVDGAVGQAFARVEAAARIAPGAAVAVGVGSRGIAQIAEITRAVVRAVRRLGGEPFIAPLMGSHGGATAEGQAAVLADLGVTEAFVGAPIRSSMEVRPVGTLPGGAPVWVDAACLAAGAVIPIARVKPHTDFRGPIESGVAKMVGLGMGKRHGAELLHSHGVPGLRDLMPLAARIAVERTRVLFGVAVVENAYDQVAEIHGVPPDGIAGEAEVRLLDRARALMARLPVDRIDTLVLDAVGKNISGTGMDTNFVGRMYVAGEPEFERPRINTIAALSLTEASHGNATGIGLADFIPYRLFRAIDFEATYINEIASGICGAQRTQIPMVLPTDRDAVCAALRACGRPDTENARLIRAHSTLHLRDIWVSEALLPELADRTDIEVLGEPAELRFDADGRLL